MEYHHSSCGFDCVNYGDFDVDYQFGIVQSTLDAYQIDGCFFVDRLSSLELENIEGNTKRYLQNEIHTVAHDERSGYASTIYHCFCRCTKRIVSDVLVLDFD